MKINKIKTTKMETDRTVAILVNLIIALLVIEAIFMFCPSCANFIIKIFI